MSTSYLGHSPPKLALRFCSLRRIPISKTFTRLGNRYSLSSSNEARSKPRHTFTHRKSLREMSLRSYSCYLESNSTELICQSPCNSRISNTKPIYWLPCNDKTSSTKLMCRPLYTISSSSSLSRTGFEASRASTLASREKMSCKRDWSQKR